MHFLFADVAVSWPSRPIPDAYAWFCMCREIAPSTVSTKYLLWVRGEVLNSPTPKSWHWQVRDYPRKRLVPSNALSAVKSL